MYQNNNAKGVAKVKNFVYYISFVNNECIFLGYAVCDLCLFPCNFDLYLEIYNDNKN